MKDKNCDMRYAGSKGEQSNIYMHYILINPIIEENIKNFDCQKTQQTQRKRESTDNIVVWRQKEYFYCVSWCRGWVATAIRAVFTSDAPLTDGQPFHPLGPLFFNFIKKSWHFWHFYYYRRQHRQGQSAEGIKYTTGTRPSWHPEIATSSQT